MTSQMLLFWLLTIVVDTAGQLAFKAGTLAENQYDGLRYYLQILRNAWILAGIGCFFVEFFIWLSFLTLVPLSNGVLLGSLNIVVSLIAIRVFFNERLTPYKLAGIALVTLGVMLVGVTA